MIPSTAEYSGKRVYRLTLNTPVTISWEKELVDGGAAGTDFYMRLTPHIHLGRAVKKVYENGHAKIVSKKADNQMKALRGQIIRDFSQDMKSAIIKGAKK